MTWTEVSQITQDLVALALPVILLAIITSLGILFLLRFLGVRIPRNTAVLPAAFAILGGICGVIAGASSEGLVGGVVTGVLGIVSVLLSYVFTKEVDEASRGAIPAIVILMVLNALIGLAVGQNWKRKWDEYERQLAEYRTEYNEIWIPLNKDYQKRVLEQCFLQYKTYQEIRTQCRYDKLFSVEP